MQAAVCLGRQTRRDGFAERRVVHETHEDFFVLVDALHDEGVQQILEDQLELILRIDGRCLLDGLVAQGNLDDLVEEQLVGLVEI